MRVLHLRDLVNNTRLRIHRDDVKVYQAPHYEGLSIANMLEFAMVYPKVVKALPSDPRDLEFLHRDYVSTVIYTLVG